MHVQIKDVNEFPPAVERESYMVEVVEGKLFDEILKVQATDQDGSEEFSTICQYHVLTRDVPFRIDSDGMYKAGLGLYSEIVTDAVDDLFE